MIVLNTPEAAEELLHNRGRKYSSRAPLHVAHDLVSDGQRLVLMPYTRECKVRVPSKPLILANQLQSSLRYHAKLSWER